MNIGLVLSGGMAKGAYQVGALRALNSFIPLQDVKYISCASIGVLNGYAYATDNLDRADKIWKSICNTDARLIISQILRSSMFQQNIVNIYNPKKPLNSSFYCALLDINHRNIVYKDLSSVDRDKIPLYLKASVAMPVYNHAVQLDDTAYFDGAMIDNIPVFPLIKRNLDYIICFYFGDTCYKFENSVFDSKIIKITFPSDSVLKQSLVLKRDCIEAMITEGYERTMFLLNSVFSSGYDDLEHVYHSINYLNKTSQNNSLRITGDVLVTNLNKITQRMTKRKIQ